MIIVIRFLSNKKNSSVGSCMGWEEHDIDCKS